MRASNNNIGLDHVEYRPACLDCYFIQNNTIVSQCFLQADLFDLMIHVSLSFSIQHVSTRMFLVYISVGSDHLCCLDLQGPRCIRRTCLKHVFVT